MFSPRCQSKLGILRLGLQHRHQQRLPGFWMWRQHFRSARHSDERQEAARQVRGDQSPWEKVIGDVQITRKDFLCAQIRLFCRKMETFIPDEKLLLEKKNIKSKCRLLSVSLLPIVIRWSLIITPLNICRAMELYGLEFQLMRVVRYSLSCANSTDGCTYRMVHPCANHAL